MTLGDAAPPATSVRDADVLRIAQRALEALAPYADVSVDTTAMVAGRPAYVLVLTPTSTLTLIGRIAVSIDAETRLPLRFQVFPRGSDAAAIEAGFTSVSFDTIDPSMFSFTPPAGTTVRQAADVIAQARASADGSGTPPVSDPQVFGQWVRPPGGAQTGLGASRRRRRAAPVRRAAAVGDHGSSGAGRRGCSWDP